MCIEIETCAENRHELMSSLNTLCYIEFDVLCNNNYLEEKLMHI